MHLINLVIMLCRSVLNDLVTWCGSYVANFDPKSYALMGASRARPQNVYHEIVEYDELGRICNPMTLYFAKHETFYCGFQAICYILCFHGVELAYQQLLSQHLHQDWEQIVASSLEPLKYCLHSIRIEFLKLALQVGILSENIWEKLSPDIIERVSTFNGNPLDSFFPFDPCLLVVLHNTINCNYRRWVGVPGLQVGTSGVLDDDARETDSEGVAMSISNSVIHQDMSQAMSLSESFGGEALIRNISTRSGSMSSVSSTKDYVYRSTFDVRNAMLTGHSPVDTDNLDGDARWTRPADRRRQWSITSQGSF